MGKKIVISLAILVLILTCVVITGLWGSRGGLSAFLSGQMSPRPDLTGPDLTGYKVSTDKVSGWTASAV
ncbi:MAG: hypothetical protein MI802_12715, partial [Desulfobacterales bacterium]|nr:hypothetical protein [Desulfobacterales bacterium]